jgi:hypothetical protein
LLELLFTKGGTKNMYKKFTKILLLIILLSPLSVYALKDRVTVSSTGWNYDYFSTYNWKGTSSKEMTKKDCEKQGGKIDPNTEVAEWVQYRATCSAEKKGKKSSSEAYGTKKIKAEVTCKQNVVKAMKSKGVKITVKDVKINGSGVYLKQYSKTRPGKDMAKSGNTDNYRYMCSVSKSGVSEKALPHETLSANGETAYCLLPGKPFKSGGDTYILKKSFDISNCKKTTDEFQLELDQLYRGSYRVLDTYTTNLTPIRVQHACGSVYTVSPVHLLMGRYQCKCEVAINIRHRCNCFRRHTNKKV